MPIYRYNERFRCLPDDPDGIFDKHHYPHFQCQIDGIYACDWCGYEILLKRGDTFPYFDQCGLHSQEWHTAPNETGVQPVSEVDPKI
jgi:hypothetical protein